MFGLTCGSPNYGLSTTVSLLCMALKQYKCCRDRFAVISTAVLSRNDCGETLL